MLSSPERYADSLNRTVEQVQIEKDIHRRAQEQLQKQLMDRSSSLSGSEKHAILCQHRFRYGRHPFVCRKCWSYIPVCVCDLASQHQQQQQNSIYWQNEKQDNNNNNNKKNLEIIVWTHHREWGLTSNTGSMLPLMLMGTNNRNIKNNNNKNYCRSLMKGLPDHDRILDEILSDASVLPIVLWPSSSSSSDNRSSNNNKVTDSEDENNNNVITLKEVQDEMDTNPQRRIVLIAVDGTWRNARRMVARLLLKKKKKKTSDVIVRQLDLPKEVVFFVSQNNNNNNNNSRSILAPLRSRGGESATTSTAGAEAQQRQVCTAEAVVGALYGLGVINQDEALSILEVTQIKIDRIKRYRGKV